MNNNRNEYTAQETLPDVFHIKDPLDVHLTLLVGQRSALLLDTGYGTGELTAFLRTLTDLPIKVLLSHGHHNHALGAMHFKETWMFQEDLPVFAEYTGQRERLRVLASANLSPQPAQAYLSADIPVPKALSDEPVDLGGLSAVPLRVPGHTPGSLALLVPQRRLLLTGDSWNPQTWVFFPEAFPIRVYAQSFKNMVKHDFDVALAPHRSNLISAEALRCFSQGLTEDGFASAKPYPIDGYEHLPTRMFKPCPGAPLVFIN